jgi:hypothetical protein
VDCEQDQDGYLKGLEGLAIAVRDHFFVEKLEIEHLGADEYSVHFKIMLERRHRATTYCVCHLSGVCDGTGVMMAQAD